MSKLAVINLKGEKVAEENIPTEFELKENPKLTVQAVNRQMANSRNSIAHTKTRGEVRGGGRKPWKQKGTGRARAGSSRSPIWIGGGVTFGPRNVRNFSKMMPQKMVRGAINIAISDIIKNKKLILVKNFEISKISTSQVFDIFSKLPIEEGKILVILEKINPNLELSLANIPYAKIIKAENINILDLLKFDYIVMTIEAFRKISGAQVFNVTKVVK